MREPGDAGASSQGAEQTLILPADGGPSQSVDGSGSVRFALGLPDERRRVRARLSYVYRDTVVQSQRLDLLPDAEDPSERAMRLVAHTDFTLSTRFGASLDQIAERPRFNILVNASSPTQHQVTVRPPGGDGEPLAFSFGPDSVAPVIAQLREQMWQRAPDKRERNRRAMVGDLEVMAPLGRTLFRQIPRNARLLIHEAPDDTVIQVTMPEDCGFTLPWNLIYDIPLESEGAYEVCPIVDDLAQGTAKIGPETRSCPHADHGEDAKNLLCPFGFWGVQKSIEVIASTREPHSTIDVGKAQRVVFGETKQGVKGKRLDQHIETLSELFVERFPDIKVERARTRNEVKSGLSTDLPFVYFLCHGERVDGHGPTQLRVGNNEVITPGDFEEWAESVLDVSSHYLWTQPRPLIFVNACEALAIDPSDLVGYLTAFIGNSRALGLIGTETRVNVNLAMDVGERFFRALLSDGATVDDALRAVKSRYLEACNLFGLVYTPYCFADLKVA